MEGARIHQKFWWVLIAFMALFLVIASILPFQNGLSKRSPEVRAVSNLKTLLLGCRAYSADNDGRYPASLELLIPDYVLDSASLESVSESGDRLPYLYYPERGNSPDPKTPIIVDPHRWGDKTYIAFQGGFVGSD